MHLEDAGSAKAAVNSTVSDMVDEPPVVGSGAAVGALGSVYVCLVHHSMNYN